MSSLLGIALVVDDINKGCNLAFRYPAPMASSPDHVSSFHKLSPPLLAKLFRPKNALCNQSFELVMDDLRFISHPVLVTRRSHPHQSSSSSGGHHHLYHTANAQNHNIQAGYTPIGSTSSSNPTPSGVNTGSSATSTTTTPSTPINPNSTGSIATTSVPNESSHGDTTMFNVIFVLEELHPLIAQEDEELAQRREHTINAFRTVAAQLANALLHEELRSGFVSKEVRELLHIRDELAQNERMDASTNNPGGGGSGGSGSNTGNHRKDMGGNTTENGAANAEVDPQTLIDVALGKCVLANDLKSVYHGLDEAGTVHVVINRWVKISLTLTDSVAVNMQSVRPYHTLLLLIDEEKILNALPADHSHQLRLLIEAANPLKSFQELAVDTSIPIHQLFRLSTHLVFWGFGKIIDTITLHNIYQVNARANLSTQSASALEFRRTFSPYELCEVLSTFSGSRRIGDYMKTLSTLKKTEYIHMLIWLLQNNFVVQLHRYIYFMIPSEGDYAAESDSFENQSHRSNHRRRHHHHHNNDNGNGYHVPSRIESEEGTPPSLAIVDAVTGRIFGQGRMTERLASNPLAFTDQERDYLDKIATTNPVFTLFKRLCVYFRGQHHLEEIMWRENLSRSEIRTVMSTYQDIIVCCLHE